MKNAILALRTFLRLALPYFRSQDRWRACGLLAGVIGSELFVVYVAVKMNQWNAGFFNAIEARNGEAVRGELIVFAFITIGAILSGMGQYWFGQTLIIRWREWMTQRYVALWMAEGRHYRIRFVDQSVDNIHLRIGNDVLLFIQRTHELGTGFLQSIVTLLSFAYILWGISIVAPLQLFGVDLAFPGYLVVLAISYAAVGTLIAHFIGWPLVPLQFRQQRFESDFRFAIARVTDYADSVALMGGEAVERAELRRRFSALVRNWVALVNRQNRLNGFIFGYYHISTVFPALVVTPAFLLGAIPLGVLMQASLAFMKVEGAFAFCVTSYAKIAEWRAVMNRVAQFEAAMGEVDKPGLEGAALDIEGSTARDLSIKNLVVRLPSGEPIAAVSALDSGAGRSAAGERYFGGGQIEPVPDAGRYLAARRGPHPSAAARACARLAPAALFPARHAATGRDLPDAGRRDRRSTRARSHGGRGPRPSGGAARRGGGVEHGAVRRRAAAFRLRACADPSTHHPAARRAGHDAGGIGGARPLRPARGQAAGHHRHLERALGRAGRLARSHPGNEWFAGCRPLAAAGARGGSGMIGQIFVGMR